MGMQPTGDYGEQAHVNREKSTSAILLAADTANTTPITAKDANHRVYVQKITLSVTTFSAKTLTFQDTAGTPVPIAIISIPATESTVPGDVTYVCDFGRRGFPLTKGKNLTMVISGAGAAGVLTYEAYEKLEGPVTQD